MTYTDQDIIDNKPLWKAVYDHEFLARVRDVIINHEVPNPEFIIRGYLHQGRVMSVNGFPWEVSQAILIDLADKARKGEPWMGYETSRRKVLEIRMSSRDDEELTLSDRYRHIYDVWSRRDYSGEDLLSAIERESRGASLIVVHGAGSAEYDMAWGARRNITRTLLELSKLAININTAVVVDSPGDDLNPLHESLVDSYFRAWKEGTGFRVSFRADYADDNEQLRSGRDFGGEQFYAEFEKGSLTRKPEVDP